MKKNAFHSFLSTNQADVAQGQGQLKVEEISEVGIFDQLL